MRIIIALSFILFGCASQEAMRIAQEKASTVTNECKQRRLAGEFGYAGSARCSQGKIIQAFSEAGAGHMDLLELLMAYRLAGAEKIDRGELTEAEAKVQYMELNARIASEIQRRNALAAQTSAMQAQSTGALLQGLGVLVAIHAAATRIHND